MPEIFLETFSSQLLCLLDQLHDQDDISWQDCKEILIKYTCQILQVSIDHLPSESALNISLVGIFAHT
jgi:hypothetical protein